MAQQKKLMRESNQNLAITSETLQYYIAECFFASGDYFKRGASNAPQYTKLSVRFQARLIITKNNSVRNQ